MSNINTNRWLIHRRQALRGVGVSLGLPLLDCMIAPGTAAPAATMPPKPKRSVFLYIPNGVNTLTWQIEQDGKQFQFSEPLASLERHRADVTPISGLHHPMVLGKHHNCDKVWLTGANVPGDGGAFRNTVSADQLMAEVHGPHTRFASLELAIEGHSLAWSRDGIQLPAERNPRQVFNMLFGVERESKNVISRRLNRRSSILDAVAGDAKRLNAKLGTDDRTKLDEYLTAVRQVEVRTERAESWLNIPKPKIDPAVEARLTRPVDLSKVREYHSLFADLMVLALKTDSTRVITCMICSESQGGSIPDIGISQSRHGLSHHNGDPEQLRRLTETDTFLVEQLSYLLDQLKSHQEEGRPLLDTTQVLWGSGMAYGHSHGNANLPTILAGGRALGYQHGQHVDFNLPKIGQYNVADANAHYRICSRPVDDNARLSNLLLTMCQRVDVETDRFQDSLGTVSQVLS
ncbi:MAG: hypothetical protein RLY70_2881 [Planctomycetota bacterium]|jgi:hypothetical protein